MRKIKFKGKTKRSGSWVHGFYANANGVAMIMDEIELSNADCFIGTVEFAFYRIIPETVCQFTELYTGVFNSLCGDKECDEIYEGDKIAVTYANQGMSNSHEHTITGVVKFKNGSFVVEWDFPKKGKYKYQTLNSVKTLGDCEVTIKLIGNIHDNQELLEVTE